ncbi:MULTISPECIES: PilZ domain-containing protein [Pseudomonas]|uniref:Cyclic diguanosine monophosphate-binding protein n=1 Tax=Pseudomonas beijingensis TaxID=2954101 RepID=A0ABY9FAU6_9PSED|nr:MULTISPECIES: PilZ domain-containing protein [unclassified Pseudomonas]WLH00472.1 PilZ domain-containing protein [Pseudomonas sp. FP2034]WLH45531.1 PilZ domain-containing protein [Pseudomonas sp. FP2262]WLI44631.1 PilZ domain-containing protein [Pseudomonas sp. FP830]
MSERRRFVRIEFHARIDLSQGPFIWPVELLDLSLKGLLIQKPEPWLGDIKQPFIADIHLSPEAEIKMEVRLTHDDHGHLGFVCERIDQESIAHLRRLVDLNRDDHDEGVLERELAALIHL